jgi:hypothetical protein
MSIRPMCSLADQHEKDAQAVLPGQAPSGTRRQKERDAQQRIGLKQPVGR